MRNVGADLLARLLSRDKAGSVGLKGDEPHLQFGKARAKPGLVRDASTVVPAGHSSFLRAGHAPLVLADARQLQPLELQQRLGYGPPLVFFANDLVGGHSHVVQKHLIEYHPAVDARDGPHCDAGGLHVNQQERDAFLQPALAAGSHKAEHPVGVLCVGCPDLRAVDDVVAVFQFRACGKRRQIAAGIRL